MTAALTVQDVVVVMNLLFTNGRPDLAAKLSADLSPAPAPAPMADTSEVEQLRARVAELEEDLRRERRNARVRQTRRNKKLAGQELLFEPLCAVDKPGERDRNETRNDVSDLDPLRSKSEDQDQTRALRARTIPLEPLVAAHPPEWAFEEWRDARPDLSEAIFRRCWERFVDHVAKKRVAHRGQKDAARHFRGWLRREDARPLERASEDDDPSAPAESESRPIARATHERATSMRLSAIEQSLALLALDERSTGPPEMAPGVA